MPDDNGDIGIAPGGYPLGMVSSPPDERDYRYPVYGVMRASAEMPEDYYGGYFPAVRDQGVTESCVAHASMLLRELQEREDTGEDLELSVNYAYNRRPNKYHWQGRGMVPREHLSTLLKEGVPPKSFWPGIDERGTQVEPQPLAPVLEAARPHRIAAYTAVDTRDILEMKSAIIERKGVLIGVPIHENFIPDAEGNIPMPAGNLYGLHLMAALYWLRKGKWIVPNSWGPKWGGITLPDGRRIPGYCYLPWSYPLTECWATLDRPTELETEVLLIEGEPRILINGEWVGPFDRAPFIDRGRFGGVFRHLLTALGGEIGDTEGVDWGRYESGQWAGKIWAKGRLRKPWPRRR